MIEIKYGKDFGDSTNEYLIATTCKTVRDFISEWLSTQPKEWGYFGIKSDKNVFVGFPNCEYRYGKIVTKEFNEEILNRTILKIEGSGGWSRSDFIFVL